MRLSLLCPICPISKGNWSYQSNASILSIVFAPAHFEDTKIKAQIWHIRAFIGHLPLYLLLAEDLNFEPSDVKNTVFLCKWRPIRPFTLQNWAIFVHPAQSIHNLYPNYTQLHQNRKCDSNSKFIPCLSNTHHLSNLN